MNLTQDPFYIGMLIVLILFFVVAIGATIPYVRDILVLALAFPQALFHKMFGDPPAEDDAH